MSSNFEATVIPDEDLAEAIRYLTRARGPSSSICPSEAARRVAPGAWRGLMADVRRVAGALVDQGELRATQQGRVVDPRTATGPIRLSISA